MSEGHARLRRVAVFRTGTHRGKTYSEGDLDRMVENFRRFSAGPRPALRVPGVLGHEERQEYLERTDIPAAAWAENAYRDGPVLYVDFGDVPPKVARLLRSKAYRTVSAEVYDEPPEGIPGKGKMLRRIAFLGGEIPQIKSLDDIPAPEPHAESGAAWKPVALKFNEARPGKKAGVFWVFSEASVMDRQQMIAKLTAAGVDAALLTDAVPDPVLAEMCRLAEGKGGGGDEFADADFDGDMARHPADRMAKMREHARKYADMYAARCKKMGENMGTVPGSTEGLVKPGDKPDAVTPDKFAELAKPLIERAVSAALEQERKKAGSALEQLDAREAELRRQSVEKFCENMVKAGKVLPAELDRGDPKSPRPTLVDRLLRADARQKVHKFSENGKTVELTELELQMREVESRPQLVRFGERSVKTGPGGAAGRDGEKAKVKEHYERFSEDFRRMGTTEEELTKAFEAAQKRDPDLTAAKFLKLKESA